MGAEVICDVPKVGASWVVPNVEVEVVIAPKVFCPNVDGADVGAGAAPKAGAAVPKLGAVAVFAAPNAGVANDGDAKDDVTGAGALTEEPKAGVADEDVVVCDPNT